MPFITTMVGPALEGPMHTARAWTGDVFVTSPGPSPPSDKALEAHSSQLTALLAVQRRDGALRVPPLRVPRPPASPALLAPPPPPPPPQPPLPSFVARQAPPHKQKSFRKPRDRKKKKWINWSTPSQVHIQNKAVAASPAPNAVTCSETLRPVALAMFQNKVLPDDEAAHALCGGEGSFAACLPATDPTEEELDAALDKLLGGEEAGINNCTLFDGTFFDITLFDAPANISTLRPGGHLGNGSTGDIEEHHEELGPCSKRQRN